MISFVLSGTRSWVTVTCSQQHSTVPVDGPQHHADLCSRLAPRPGGGGAGPGQVPQFPDASRTPMTAVVPNVP